MTNLSMPGTGLRMRLEDFVEVEPVLMRIFLRERLRGRDWHVVRQNSEVFVSNISIEKVQEPDMSLLLEKIGMSDLVGRGLYPDGEIRRLYGENGSLVGVNSRENCGGLFEYDRNGTLVTEHKNLDRGNLWHAYSPGDVLGVHRTDAGIAVLLASAQFGNSGCAEIYGGEIGRGLGIIKIIDIKIKPVASGIHSDGRLLVAGWRKIFGIDIESGTVTPVPVKLQQECWVRKHNFRDSDTHTERTNRYFQLAPWQSGFGLGMPHNVSSDGKAIYLGGRGVVTKIVPADGEHQVRWLVHADDKDLVEEVRDLTVTGSNVVELSKRYGRGDLSYLREPR